jgi:hypothetical protein
MKRFHVAAVALIFCLLIAAQFSIANAASAPDLSGKVIETMDSASYTYVLIEKDGKKTWVAVPETKVEVGQDIAFSPGMPMVNFRSKTLKRTFDVIYFSNGVIK